jgi:hypothetical protein
MKFGIINTKVMPMRLEEAKTLYQGEWIAFRQVEEGDNPEGEVILHNKDRRTFDKDLLQRGLTDIYITFAGPPVPEGYAVIWLARHHLLYPFKSKGLRFCSM